MTQLNWNRTTFNRRPSDYCGDDLPPAGSTRDATRYLGGRAENDARRSDRFRSRKADQQRRQNQSTRHLHPRQAAAINLSALAGYAMHANFPQWNKEHRNFVINKLVELAASMRRHCGNAPDTDEFVLLLKADQLVANLRDAEFALAQSTGSRSGRPQRWSFSAN